MHLLHLARWLRWTLLAFVALIVAARIAAPYWIERFVNDRLAQLDGYTGSIGDVDLNLWRGAYEVEDLRIEKTDGKVPVPFVSAERIDLGVAWGALLHGAIVARIALYRPEVNFVQGPTKAASQNGEETDWRDALEDLVPLKIDRLVVVDGEIHYRDFHRKPKVDVVLDHLAIEVNNLTNSKDLSKSRVAQLSVDAVLMRSGRLSIDGSLDPFARAPTFDLKVRLEKLQIPQLNDFLKAYLNVDANRGTLALYADVKAENGSFKGYVKPLIEHLDLLKWKEEDERPLDKLWEGLVGAVAAVFKNYPEDQLASRVPLEGRFDSPDVETWRAIVSLLRNAFIQALRHGFDQASHG